jgi:hypothetical protein
MLPLLVGGLVIDNYVAGVISDDDGVAIETSKAVSSIDMLLGVVEVEDDFVLVKVVEGDLISETVCEGVMG